MPKLTEQQRQEIIAERKRSNVSLQELANAVGVDQAGMSNILQGRRYISEERLARLHEALRRAGAPADEASEAPRPRARKSVSEARAGTVAAPAAPAPAGGVQWTVRPEAAAPASRVSISDPPVANGASADRVGALDGRVRALDSRVKQEVGSLQQRVGKLEGDVQTLVQFRATLASASEEGTRARRSAPAGSVWEVAQRLETCAEELLAMDPGGILLRAVLERVNARVKGVEAGATR